MQIYIDGDGCPVVEETLTVARRYAVPCTICCDTSHVFEKPGAKTLVFSKGADSVDFALVNLIKAGDLVVTQDYGLAAMCLARKAFVLDQNGREYRDDNIDAMLLQRHTARKIRAGGGRLRGPAKRKSEQDAAYQESLEALLQRVLQEETEWN